MVCLTVVRKVPSGSGSAGAAGAADAAAADGAAVAAAWMSRVLKGTFSQEKFSCELNVKSVFYSSPKKDSK
jgi:hypothetical protein